jgi:predicted Rossmann fold nucleotide-binding protein DprA/Smf involved in DNA uptake
MSLQAHELTPDAQAIVLLCGRFGDNGSDSVKPLSRNQYNEVANWLHNNGMRPADLLDKSGREQLSVFGEEGKITESRLQSLLDRGTALAMAVEEWTNKGGWILTRSDDEYPTRFRRRLKHLAPPVLYGVGDQSLLECGGASMVGSRDSEEAALSFIRDLARRCADQGIAVVSGGARGVDQASMDAALEADGLVVGALANGLATTARKKTYRNAIADERLTLVSAYKPDSGFQVWKAMDRNKHIYALSDGAIVAHSAHGSGGTWSGATENLDHEWVPLSVLAAPPIPKGNQKLIEKGGRPIDRRLLREGVDLKEWLFTRTPLTELRSAIRALTTPSGTEEGEPTPEDRENTSKETAFSIDEIREYLHENGSGDAELFPFVWPVLKQLLGETRRSQDVKAYFDDLRPKQAQDWLMMAAERGLAVREEGPVRDSLPQPQAEATEGKEAAENVDGDPPSGDGVSSNGEQTDVEAKKSALSDSSPSLFDEAKK